MGAKIELHIDFTRYTSHIELIRELSPAFNAEWDEDVVITINLFSYSLLYSDMLAIVACLINHLREKGVRVTGRFYPFQNKTQADYASRVNFFKLVGLDYEESFLRGDPSGKFTEIRRFYSDKNSADKIAKLHEDIVLILHNAGIERGIMALLDSCLYEVMDNTLNHSELGHGWACCQYFKERKEIRLIVLDSGRGIHKALTTEPTSEYKHLTEEEAVLKCIEKGVTNGKGLGIGLWATSQFIRENGGEMLIYSGNHYINCHSDAAKVQNSALWNGTIVFMKINTDIPVNHTIIYGENSTIEDDYQWFIEKKLGVPDNLW